MVAMVSLDVTDVLVSLVVVGGAVGMVVRVGLVVRDVTAVVVMPLKALSTGDLPATNKTDASK